jgi:hypothetical protein
MAHLSGMRTRRVRQEFVGGEFRTPRSGGPKGGGQDARRNPEVHGCTSAAKRRMRESGLPLRHFSHAAATDRCAVGCCISPLPQAPCRDAGAVARSLIGHRTAGCRAIYDPRQCAPRPLRVIPSHTGNDMPE